VIKATNKALKMSFNLRCPVGMMADAVRCVTTPTTVICGELVEIMKDSLSDRDEKDSYCWRWPLASGDNLRSSDNFRDLVEIGVQTDVDPIRTMSDCINTR
jgi:hypothetical protein